MVSLTNGETNKSSTDEQSLNHKEQVAAPLKVNHEMATDDPQALVIASLRSQISDLFSQVSQLNNKLVQSYDRVSDLEDELHISSSKLRASSLQISQLELERAQHLAALNTGLLVEREHVTTELNRLMEKATEEAARRGQAESARENIEKDLDDLSANLFQQANSMVADARWKTSLSERKVEEAELALKSAEDAVGSMQLQMQLLREEKEKTEIEIAKMRETVGKGKWVEKSQTTTVQLKLLSLHTPYEEFVLFVAHLRSIRPSAPHPPPIPTLLSLPFLARLQAEDSDPTIRLDFAPSLNWLSRRSVLSAIHAGQLTIEPVSSAHLLVESSPSSGPASMISNYNHHNLTCALCGAMIYSPPPTTQPPPPTHPSLRNSSGHSMTSSWSTNIFQNPFSNSATQSPPTTPTHANSPSLNGTLHQQVYVFRISQQQAAAGQQVQQRPLNYPLCPSGWCLTRLRSTCSLWAFIRTGVIDKVWEEEVAVIPVTPQKEKPPLPPRRRTKITVSNIWGMASSALSKERISSKGSDTGSEKDLPIAPDNKSKLLPNIKTGGLPPPLPKRSAERSASAGASRSDSPMFSSGGSHSLDGVVKEDHAMTSSSDDSKVSPPPQSEHRSSSEQEDATGSVSKEKYEIKPITASNMSLIPSGSDETHDEFTTPKEELSIDNVDVAEAVSSALVASDIPLPESRPETPSASVDGIQRTYSADSADSTGSTSVTSAANTGEEKDTAAVLVTASTPAPALPPRAAARRPAPPPPSPPTEPQLNRKSSSEAADQIQPQEKLSTVISAPSENSLNGPISPADGDSAQSDTTTSTVSVSTEKAPDTNSSTPAIDTVLNTSENHSVEPKVDEELSLNTPSTIVSALPEKSDYIPEVSSTNGIVTEADTSTDKESTLSTAGSFVGDVTWEERTWKEIVRLREEMFWARVGVLR